jgi:DNA-binding response OmpR family regulator
MKPMPDVLLVAPDSRVAARVLSYLTEAGMRVTLVDDFETGREQLQSLSPDLLISEVRLGDYNGLHLALRASSCGIPAIILGDEDVVLKREARNMGAAYLHPDEDQQRLTAAIRAAGIRIPVSRFGGHGTHAA